MKSFTFIHFCSYASVKTFFVHTWLTNERRAAFRAHDKCIRISPLNCRTQKENFPSSPQKWEDEGRKQKNSQLFCSPHSLTRARRHTHTRSHQTRRFSHLNRLSRMFEKLGKFRNDEARDVSSFARFSSFFLLCRLKKLISPNAVCRSVLTFAMRHRELIALLPQCLSIDRRDPRHNKKLKALSSSPPWHWMSYPLCAWPEGENVNALGKSALKGYTASTVRGRIVGETMTSLLFEIRSIHYQLLFFPPRARFSLSLVLFIDFHYMRNFSPVGISRGSSTSRFRPPPKGLCAHTSTGGGFERSFDCSCWYLFEENGWPIMWAGNGIHIGSCWVKRPPHCRESCAADDRRNAIINFRLQQTDFRHFYIEQAV